jgi:hypothetical protein
MVFEPQKTVGCALLKPTPVLIRLLEDLNPQPSGDVTRTIPFSLYSKDAVFLKIVELFRVLVEPKKILPWISD